MLKFEKRFIQNYDDPFDKVRATLLFRFVIIFITVFFIPIFTSFTLKLYIAFSIHIFAFLLLMLMLYLLTKIKNLEKLLLIFFSFTAVIETLITLSLNYNENNITNISFIILFMILSGLTLKGFYRKLFTFFIFWIPLFYPIINITFNEVLTVPFLAEKTIADTPIYLSILPLALVIYILNVNEKAANDAKNVIKKQKDEIVLKNKEITDSIVYSKKIQQSILPKEYVLQNLFKDSFIIYIPKDLVSGDFYYINQKSNQVYIAAADCTGHGVPGAFMSLIGYKELDIACSQNDNPNEILFSLNNQIKSTLNHYEENYIMDGMDIALVKITKNNVFYSGANRPLWFIKNNSSEILDIKGTKAAIGGTINTTQTFDLHKFLIEKGDTIYLFSDGIVDQFGGVKDKKLTSKKLKAFLLSISNLNMKEQHEKLIEFYNNWKGENNEQTDDILMIGIKF